MSEPALEWTEGCGLTPYRVRCFGRCGAVNLTNEEYNQQMSRPNARWNCPRCGHEARWDDTWHEGWLDSMPDGPEDEDEIEEGEEVPSGSFVLRDDGTWAWEKDDDLL